MEINNLNDKPLTSIEQFVIKLKQQGINAQLCKKVELKEEETCHYSQSVT
jgi:hypothetical protein